MLTAKFVFADHINCIIARQRLKRGRLIVRQKKLFQLGQALGFSFAPVANQATNTDSATDTAKSESPTTSELKLIDDENSSSVIREPPVSQHVLIPHESPVDESSLKGESVIDKVDIPSQDINNDDSVSKNTSKNEFSSNVQLLPPSPVFELSSGNDLSNNNVPIKGSLNRALGTVDLDPNDTVRLLPPVTSNTTQKYTLDNDMDNHLADLKSGAT